MTNKKKKSEKKNILVMIIELILIKLEEEIIELDSSIFHLLYKKKNFQRKLLSIIKKQLKILIKRLINKIL